LFFTDEINDFFTLRYREDVLSYFPKPLFLLLVKWLYGFILLLGLILQILEKKILLSVKLLFISTVGLAITSLGYYFFSDFTYYTSSADIFLVLEIVTIIVLMDIVKSKKYLLIGDKNKRYSFIGALIIGNIILSIILYYFYLHCVSTLVKCIMLMEQVLRQN